MKDPRDPGTIDLVEACQRPLTGAERQARRRKTLRDLKAAEGLRPYMLNDFEVRYLWSAIDDAVTVREDQADLSVDIVRNLLDKLFAKALPGSIELIGTSLGVQNILKRHADRAEDGWRAHKDLKRYADSLSPELHQVRQERDQLRAEVERLTNETRLLENERNAAFRAADVFKERLRVAGLSMDCRG